MDNVIDGMKRLIHHGGIVIVNHWPCVNWHRLNKVWDGSLPHGRSVTTKPGSGTIATPAQLHSFKAVNAAGLFPDLHTYVVGSNDLGDDIPACLNPPLDDFILGDETLSPVPAPPPDCGNGWWNYTIQDCSYWVPPPPPPPCPVCEVCDGENITDETGIMSPTMIHWNHY